ncbi:MAG: cell division protein Fic [Treponematales bacterium]
MTLLEEIDARMAEVNKLRPFEGNSLKQLNEFFRVETTYSSNAVEGGTLTLQETKLILEDGITVGEHPLRDIYDAVGHAAAYDYMSSLINSKNITEENIKQCHHLFSRNIPGFERPGDYRASQVFISGSQKSFPKPGEVPAKMKQFVAWLNTERGRYHPVQYAAEAHRRLVNIHPFSDGNGRVSRLVMNTILFQDRYFPVSIPVLTKQNYYNALENTGNPAVFQNYIAGLELQTVKDLMRHMRVSYPAVNASRESPQNANPPPTKVVQKKRPSPDAGLGR